MKQWQSTALGLVGLAIIGGNVGAKIWSAISSPATATTRVCTVAHYSVANARCLQSDHALALHAAGHAYVVTDVSDPSSGVNAYRVVQQYANGSTFDVATLSTDLSTGKHYVVDLAALWGADGAKIQPGSYQIVTQYGGGHSTQYSLTIEPPARPRRADAIPPHPPPPRRRPPPPRRAGRAVRCTACRSTSCCWG